MEVTTSTEFRKTFARLKEPTVVTVSGHPIGIYVPMTAAHEVERKMVTVGGLTPQGNYPLDVGKSHGLLSTL